MRARPRGTDGAEPFQRGSEAVGGGFHSEAEGVRGLGKRAPLLEDITAGELAMRIELGGDVAG